MNFDQMEALSSLLATDASEHESRGGASAPTEKNNPNAGVDPLFKTVIKSGPSAPTAAAAAAAAAPPPPKPVDTRQIWSAEEVDAARDLLDDGDVRDGRAQPEYDILYGQDVSAEERFLGLSLKDASSASCERIVVKVKLPGAKASEIDLQMTQTRMRVTTNQFRLFLYLPHEVNDAAGRAQWDGKKATLSVTLPIIRREEDEL